MDRASGSGVFARDPDAMLDLIELDITDDLRKQEENKAVCAVCKRYLDAHYEWEDEFSQDDLLSQARMMDYCKEHLGPARMKELQAQIDKELKAVSVRTAWRIDGTLREFPKFAPVNLWFDYPIHRPDDAGSLKDIQPDEEKPPWQRGTDKIKKNAKDRKADRKKALEEAIEGSNFGEAPTIKDVAGYLGVSERTARDRIKEHGGYTYEDGKVRKKD